MQIIRNIMRKLHNGFRHHYSSILFVSTFTAVMVGFLHLEMTQYNKDFIYWINLLQYLYQEVERSALLWLMFLISVTIIFVGMIIMANKRSLEWYDEMSQLEVKKRYSDFLLLRLIADIDETERKYLRSNKTGDAIALKSFILAHESMKESIKNFRFGALKLLTPNELEITMPIEVVYGVPQKEIDNLRRTRFGDMDVSANESEIRHLVNPIN